MGEYEQQLKSTLHDLHTERNLLIAQHLDREVLEDEREFIDKLVQLDAKIRLYEQRTKQM